MVSKNTILTERRLKDIEEVIASFGRLVTSEEIHKALGAKYSGFVLKKRIYELKEKGWLVPLRRGLYFISDITSRGFVSISPFVLASAFNKGSYISLESALSFHNFLEQMLRTTASVTTRGSKQYTFQGHIYRYMSIQKKLYFGFKTEPLEGYYIKVAELEKALLDYLYFKNDIYSVDLLIEILGKVKGKIDSAKLFDYARAFPEATKRRLGFILDLLEVDTSGLYSAVGRTGYSKLTSHSKRFNAKWRIYYDDRFAGQVKA